MSVAYIIEWERPTPLPCGCWCGGCACRVGLSARKNAVQPLFCGRGGGVRCPGQPSRSLLALAAGAAVLCGGDVVLALYNKLHRPGLFLAGLGAFLAGHSLFVWGLCQLQPMGWPVPLAAVLGAGGAAVLSGMPGMQTGRMRPLVVLYAAFVSALLGKGLQLAFGMGQPWCFLVLAGAVLFWISDLLILFLYFYPPRRTAVHVANLLTYYYAMFLIAVSLAV